MGTSHASIRTNWIPLWFLNILKKVNFHEPSPPNYYVVFHSDLIHSSLKHFLAKIGIICFIVNQLVIFTFKITWVYWYKFPVKFQPRVLSKTISWKLWSNDYQFLHGSTYQPSFSKTIITLEFTLIRIFPKTGIWPVCRSNSSNIWHRFDCNLLKCASFWVSCKSL